MTADLERELRRLMADPPVDTADADAIGPVAALGRRVARVRARRRVATLSAVVVLVGGLSSAAALTVRSAQVSSSASPASGQAAGSDRGGLSVPTEVAEATRTALAQL